MKNQRTASLFIKLLFASLLVGLWTDSARADGENVEENNFPIWRCSNTNNWTHHGSVRQGKVMRATCKTYRNAKGQAFVIEIRYIVNNSTGHLVFCRGRSRCEFEIPGTGLADDISFRNSAHVSRSRSKDVVLMILRPRNAYWSSRRSQIFRAHGVMKVLTNNVRRGITLERGYDRPGRAFARYPMKRGETADACRLKCASNRACKAFTYAPGVCFLKSHAYNRMRSPTITSGKRIR